MPQHERWLRSKLVTVSFKGDELVLAELRDLDVRPKEHKLVSPDVLPLTACCFCNTAQGAEAGDSLSGCCLKPSPTLPIS